MTPLTSGAKDPLKLLPETSKSDNSPRERLPPPLPEKVLSVIDPALPRTREETKVQFCMRL